MLESGRRPVRTKASGKQSSRSSVEARKTSAFSGPHVSVGPFVDDQGARYTVRLERVPGGVRFAEWAGSLVRPRAPVLALDDLVALVAGAPRVLVARDAEALVAALRVEPTEAPAGAGAGISDGRAGDFREQLRVELHGPGRVRVARWVLRPGADWELRDAPPMLPAGRYAEALADAVRQGVLAPASERLASARP